MITFDTLKTGFGYFAIIVVFYLLAILPIPLLVDAGFGLFAIITFIIIMITGFSVAEGYLDRQRDKNKDIT